MLKKSFLIKIPKIISIYVDSKKGFLVIKNGSNSFLLKTFNFRLIKIRNKIEFLYIVENNSKSYTKYFRKLKKLIFDVSYKSFRKLKLQGIGYKFSIISNNLIHLKLGFSHSIYFKLPEYITAKLTKNNILFLFSDSTEKLVLISESIKNCKIPDPYKGKGILYVNEKINLKIGKKS